MPKEEDEKQEKIELEKLEKPILTSMLDVQYLLKIETEPLRFDKTMTENLKIGLTLGQATDGFCGFIDLFIKIADGKLSLNDNIEIPAEDLKELKYMSEQFKANSSLQGRLPTDKQVDDFTEKQITNLDKYGHIYLIYINRNGKHGNAIRYDKEIINGKPVITKTFYNLGAGTVGDNVMAGGLEAIGKLLRQETVDPAITYLVDEKHYKDAIKRDIVNSVNASYKKVKTPSRGGSEKNIEFLHSSGKDVVIQQHGTCSVKCMFEATRGAVSEHTFHSFTDLVYNSSFDGESLVPTFITPLQRQDYNKYYEILSEEKQTVTDLCFNKIWSKFPDIKSLVESSMLMTGLVSKFYKEIFPPMEISNNKDEELTKNAFSSIKESFLKVIEHNGGTLREDNFKKVLKDVREDIKTNPSISNDLKKSMIITEQQQKIYRRTEKEVDIDERKQQKLAKEKSFMKEQRSLPRRMLNWVTGSTTDLGKNFNESRKIAKDHFDRNISTIKRDQAINAENNVKFRPDTIADYNDNWHDAKSEVSKTKSTGPYADAEIQKAELSKYRTQVNSDTPETGRKWKREGNKWEQFVDATENKNEDVMPKNLQDTAKKVWDKKSQQAHDRTTTLPKSRSSSPTKPTHKKNPNLGHFS